MYSERGGVLSSVMKATVEKLGNLAISVPFIAQKPLFAPPNARPPHISRHHGHLGALWWRYIGQEWSSATAVGSKAGKTRDFAEISMFFEKLDFEIYFF